MLDQYRQIYHDTVGAIHQTEVIALASAAALKDFPKNLPSSSKDRFVKTMRELATGLTKAMEDPGGSSEPRARVTRPSKQVETDEPFISPAIMMVISRVLSGKQDINVDLIPLIYAQQLVITIAHLDAFMGDSLRTICRSEPRLLRRSKQISWERVLEAGAWDPLIDSLVEEYAYELGWMSIAERVSYFRDDVGVTIKIPQEDLTLLTEAEQLRHLVVHNGGRTNREFVRRTGRVDVPIGQVVPITREHVGKVSSATLLVCSDVFVGVATKFFGANESTLTGVFRRVENGAA